jgi:hypothetical protein
VGSLGADVAWSGAELAGPLLRHPGLDPGSRRAAFDGHDQRLWILTFVRMTGWREKAALHPESIRFYQHVAIVRDEP